MKGTPARVRPLMIETVSSRRSPAILGILDRIDTYMRSPAKQIDFVLKFTVIGDLPAADATLHGPPSVSNVFAIESNRLRLLHFSTMRETLVARLHPAYSTFRRSRLHRLDSRLLFAERRKLLRHQTRRENKCKRDQNFVHFLRSCA
jgi:hypothetical protein